jgi:XTP/dITP diphosphohydrolase
MLLASSNEGKLSEFRSMASSDTPISLDLFPRFSTLPPFDESAPTFAENAAGKALHYSAFTDQLVLADDSGLAVTALGGAPGVRSARYAGSGASDTDRIAKLLKELGSANTADRGARFVCVLALARCGGPVAIVSDTVHGTILDAPRGRDGFGYDPIFLLPELGKTFAEVSREEKNRFSHRGRAFRKLVKFLATAAVV